MAAMESFLPLVVLARSSSSSHAIAMAALLLCIVSAAIALWLWLQKPRRLAETFRLQGIDGPPASSFLSGNLPEMQARVVAAAAGPEAGGGLDFEKDGFDDYCKRIFPYFEKWRKAYDGSEASPAAAAPSAAVGRRRSPSAALPRPSGPARTLMAAHPAAPHLVAPASSPPRPPPNRMSPAARRGGAPAASPSAVRPPPPPGLPPSPPNHSKVERLKKLLAAAPSPRRRPLLPRRRKVGDGFRSI